MQSLRKIRKDLASSWDRKVPKKTAADIPWHVLEAMAIGLSDDTRLPRDVLTECIRTRDVAGLFSIIDSLEVTEYASPDLLLQDRLACESFSKFVFDNSPFDKREMAHIRFYKAEHMCRMSNFRIKHTVPNGRVNAVLHDAIRRISGCLGSFRLSEMLGSARFGPGSTLCVSGSGTGAYFKYACLNPSVSSGAFPYAEALIQHDIKWRAYLSGIHPTDVCGPFNLASCQFSPELLLKDYNKVTFVAKNAKTERSIAIEPYFNVFFQLGVGEMIRNRLKRSFCVDLNDQSRNRNLAKVASVEQDIATVDFSMASDTIAIEAVRLLVPPEWFDHLDRLRSRDYLMDGVISPSFKFSSMGNGFTFELETLIFHSIALACAAAVGEKRVNLISTYGDDVIVPTSVLQLFQETTEYLGFKINDEKSFSTGPFRESCGKDYLVGTDVRPVYCKELSTVKHVVSLANRLSALNRAVGVGSRVNRLVSGALSVLRRHIPRDVRRTLVGPPSEVMDTYIHSDNISEWEFCKYTGSHWLVPSIVPVSKVLRRSGRPLGLLLSQSLAKCPRSGFRLYHVNRDAYRYCFIEAAAGHTVTLRNVTKSTFSYTPVWSPGYQA